MKIQKYVNKKLLSLCILTVSICTFILVYIKNGELNKVIEITMPDNATSKDTLKNVKTVETSSNKISTNLGK